MLLGAAVLTIVAMAHHPTGLDPVDPSGGMTLGGFIHGTMIIVLAATLWGLAEFSLRLGFRGLVSFAMLAYATSFLGNLIAAVINGFIVPALAAEVDHAGSRDLFVLLWQSNQATAKLGVYAAGVAFFFWSVALLRRKTSAGLVVGSVGLVAAVVPTAALFLGAITLNVSGALLAYAMQAAWTGLVGLQMMRGAL